VVRVDDVVADLEAAHRRFDLEIGGERRRLYVNFLN
jgi:hypothetical protein